MNTKLRTEAKHNFEKYLSKLMNNSVHGKTNRKCEEMQRCQTCNHRQIFSRRLVSKLNYQSRKWFSKKLLGTNKGKNELMNLFRSGNIRNK